MGCMREIHSISKGAIFYALDQISTAPNARDLLERLAMAIGDRATSDFSDLETVYELYLFRPLNAPPARIAAAKEHLRQRWHDLASPDLFFREFQPIAPIVAMGIMKTIEESLKGHPQPLPIDSWWLADHNKVEMITLLSKQQVTLLFATPRPPIRTPRELWSPDVEAWTTGRLGVVTRKFERRP